METSKTTGEQMAAARQLEKEGRLGDAAAIYQKLFNRDPGARPVIERLLIMYRKLKDYPKELSVLNEALSAVQRRQKGVREEWIKSHPQAASVGRSMLRQLEKSGDLIGSMGVDPMVGRWIKRKELVAGRISGKKGKAGKPLPRKKAKKLDLRIVASEEKRRKREEAAAAKKKAVAEKKAAVEEKARVALQKKEERERKVAEAKHHPSLFIVLLRYLVSLEKIDAVMKQHMVYLNKHYDTRDFLVSGRLVPRTGGVILARGKNRAAVGKIVRQDPFVKRKLASADIIEFSASQSGKGLEGWLS